MVFVTFVLIFKFILIYLLRMLFVKLKYFIFSKEKYLNTTNFTQIGTTLSQNPYHLSSSSLPMENSAAYVDMISNLPDELLCHILSFLPTKLAFTTTLLSKRWAPLCYSLAALCFDDDTVKDVGDFNGFCGFVDKLMLFPSATKQPIKTFHLKLSRFYEVDHQSFNAWAEAAKQRRMEEFHLILDNVTLKNLTIFTSKTLVVVQLESLKVEGENLSVDLPTLITLHLRCVCFESQNNFVKLLKVCPILQYLHTSFVTYTRHDENNNVEEFKSLFLSKLVRAYICSTKLPFKGILVFQNLIHIRLWFIDFFDGWDRVVDLLKNCPKLQILFIRKVC